MKTTAPTLSPATAALAASAAKALVALLPTTATLTASPSNARDAPLGSFGSAVVVSVVAEASADLALVLSDAEAIAAAAAPDGATVSAADVLRPALEAAAAVLGTGVLGAAALDDATALFTDTETQVFELKNGRARAGWFAIRVRTSALLAGGAPARPLGNDEIIGKLGRINNIEMSLTVEIGRTRIPVRDVLGLEPGAVIELDRSAGAPADVLLNGRLIAHGEIVVIDQDYAVRITKILDAIESLA